MNNTKTDPRNINNFGLNLYKVRTAFKITVDHLAEQLDVSTRIVYEWESGKKTPTFPRALQIAAFLGVTIDSLLS
jgi:transcriptional regulator with XRE-family HTH domain